MPRAIIVLAYLAAGLVDLFLLVILASVWFDEGTRSRDFLVSEILVALIMLAILAVFWDRGVARLADRRELLLITPRGPAMESRLDGLRTATFHAGVHLPGGVASGQEAESVCRAAYPGT